jgi:ribonuclease Z
MDTRLCDAAFELADDADLLVCESTFADADAALADD